MRNNNADIRPVRVLLSPHEPTQAVAPVANPPGGYSPCPPTLPRYSSSLLFKEGQQRSQEALWVLHLRNMADARQYYLAGVHNVVV